MIGRAETLAFLAAQPVSVIWGVGKAMQERLARDGLTTHRRICRSCDERDARAALRQHRASGSRASRAARTTATVSPEREAKSISAETTFDRDIAAAAELLPILRRTVGAGLGDG